MLTILFSLGLTGLVSAEDLKPGQYRALIISNYDYGSPSENLDGAKNDLIKLENMFENQVFNDNKKVEVTVRENLTGLKILLELKNTFKDNKENDISYIYYGGHGTILDGESSLVGVNKAGVTVSQIEEVLRDLPGKFIIIIDACNSGGFVDNDQDTPGDISGDFNMGVRKIFQPSLRPRSILRQDKYIVMTSASKDQLSYEDYKPGWGKGGVFTRELVKGNGYRGEFLADANGDGKVSLNEIYKYIDGNMKRRLRDRSDVQVYPEDSEFIIGSRRKEPVKIEDMERLLPWKDRFINIKPSDIWELRFDEELDQASIAGNIYLLGPENIPIDLDYSLHRDKKGLDVYNYKLMEDQTSYRLVVGEAIKAKNSRHSKNLLIYFKTK